jgi:DNA-binding SARP family transcriptional activator
MEFLVLGPLEVRHDGEPIELRGSKRRALLALLILHANEVVRTDRLVDELWGEHPPENAAAALQNHVSRLRKDLGADVLVTKPWGYVLRADPETIDLLRFEGLVAEARTLAAQERRERLRDALALWRGPALADVAAEPALVSEVARLEELRLSALEQRVDTDLELGGEPGLVAELESLVAKHPLRERLRGQLILALYRAAAGRRRRWRPTARRAACSSRSSASSRAPSCASSSRRSCARTRRSSSRRLRSAHTMSRLRAGAGRGRRWPSQPPCCS